MLEKLLIATLNPGKTAELRNLLRELRAQLVTPDDLDLHMEINETGSTYAENARLKAATFSTKSGLPCLADDTGLEVAVLSGAPGLHSKRFSPNPNATDSDRRRLLLATLRNHTRPWHARFVCVVVLALPDGRVFFSEGECAGEIIPEERGSGGFGYDRLFLFPQIHKTMAELGMVQKNRVSHRAAAVRGILPLIKSL